ncbi:MAG TPA: bifunctional precorrin-2 dehydrogenase/sirohydrochlorin ferrochelatase [Bacteroidetes bacterium]|nr:bifunctional precorrin-2 dehydrogenase/sirohydrochlorin ferrochelatase [Bacteroidota bacterium]HEX04478.1 bifunctional precorrin-2 dehydrogenase/sirohydrochlorin ferrochelatase [Bacteroidota bacterium]
MSTLPLIFRGDRISALVVGGGQIALRKIQNLMEVGAHVTVIAPHVIPEIKEICHQNHYARLLERMFCTGDTRLRRHHDPRKVAFNLVIAATDDNATNKAISAECQADGIPVNIVDVPELCTVYFAAVVRDEPLMISISTEGEAPFLARHMKHELNDFTKHWAPRVRWGSTFRKWVKDQVSEFSQREKMLGTFLEVSDGELATWDIENPPLSLWEGWAAQLNIQLKKTT